VQRSGHPGFGEGNLSVLAHARPGPAKG
jgi:hypothetical protein